MTSGQFKSVSIGSIHVDREARQRRELKDIDVLADSLSRLGLIHPLVVDRELKLVAGERRHAAALSLGWDTITVQFADSLDPAELHAIELEENVKRQDIPWQELCAAVLEYHELRNADGPWSQDQTAEALGLDRTTVSKHIGVALELRKGNQMVSSAGTLSTATGIVARAAERKEASIKAGIMATVQATAKPKLILNEDFTQWAPGYTGQKFNFIHCDFPYGIGADEFDQGGAKAHGGYTDTFEHYVKLIWTLEAAMQNVVDESAHLIFWFSQKHYTVTKGELERMGWRIDDHALVWFRNDNSGILPDPNRGPRRVYETAFFGSRGDRKIVRAVSNLFPHPSVKDKHMSEKPEGMLAHFFRMVVDEHTRLLDPTAGSGSAIRAGRAAGAGAVLGLEINPEYVERATLALGG